MQLLPWRGLNGLMPVSVPLMATPLLATQTRHCGCSRAPFDRARRSTRSRRRAVGPQIGCAKVSLHPCTQVPIALLRMSSGRRPVLWSPLPIRRSARIIRPASFDRGAKARASVESHIPGASVESPGLNAQALGLGLGNGWRRRMQDKPLFLGVHASLRINRQC
jgi:hypothetical protein